MTPIEQQLHELAPGTLGAVLRRFGDFAACEDAVQEALLAAATQWPVVGLPREPAAWLNRVASRRMLDHLRSESARHHREAAVAEAMPRVTSAREFDQTVDEELDPDDTLALLFMCCHPSLTPASAVALTLRAVGGLSTAEIARALLMPERSVGARITRAKQAIRRSRIPFAIPEASERPGRIASVLRVLYLVFNEGYTASSGPDLHRASLADEAIRLTRILHGYLREDGNVSGLLALMLLTNARRPARTGSAGELIPLDEQDRSLWDRPSIAEGLVIAEEALARGPVGEYALLAAIAAVHAEAASADETDWPQLLALYEILQQVSANPLATLNCAVAAAMVHGPAVGLAMLATVEDDERVEGSHRLPAVRAHLHERAGNLEAAVLFYRAAAARSLNLPERDYLLRKAAAAEESIE